MLARLLSSTRLRSLAMMWQMLRLPLAIQLFALMATRFTPVGAG
jgi:hypothetical protein